MLGLPPAVSTLQRSADDLISDAAYLFKYRSLLPRKEPLHYMQFSVSNCRALSQTSDRIYICDPKVESGVAASTGTLLATLSMCSTRGMLRLSVLKATRIYTEQGFYTWLLSSSAVSRIPILIRDGKLTAEWKFLRKKEKLDLLRVLRETRLVHEELREAVKRLQIRCRDDIARAAFRYCSLPTKKLLQACPRYSLCETHRPEDLEISRRIWSSYHRWGDRNAEELGALAEMPPGSVQKETVHAIISVPQLESEAVSRQS